MKSFIYYGVQTNGKEAYTRILSLDGGGYVLTREKTRKGELIRLKSKLFKTLPAAVRASRRWVHEVMGDEYAKIS